MPDVLGRVEHLESEAIQELTLCQQAADGLQSPASLLCQISGDRLELRDIIFSETFDVPLELLDYLVRLIARISHHQSLELRVAVLPHAELLGRVIDVWNDRVVNFVVECNLSDHLTALTVDRVTEARVVSFLNTIAFTEHSVADLIEVLDTRREPGHLDRIHLLNLHSNLTYFLECLLNIMIMAGAFKVDREIDVALVAQHKLARSRLDSRHVNVVARENGQHLVQDTLGLV